MSTIVWGLVGLVFAFIVISSLESLDDRATRIDLESRRWAVSEWNAEGGGRLGDSGAGGQTLSDRIEQHKIVDSTQVARRRHRYASLQQLVGIGFPLVAQHVVLVGDHQGRRQALQLFERG